MPPSLGAMEPPAGVSCVHIPGPGGAEAAQCSFDSILLMQGWPTHQLCCQNAKGCITSLGGARRAEPAMAPGQAGSHREVASRCAWLFHAVRPLLRFQARARPNAAPHQGAKGVGTCVPPPDTQVSSGG